jgi:glutamyl/glutaminyl-tRNA synthetase
LLFEGNKKLSKRSGNGTEDYKDFSKAAMLNWLLKFGWSHPDPTFDKKYPTLSMDQMICYYGNISKNNQN